MGGAACTTNIDYISTAGTLTFAPSVASQTFGVVLCAGRASPRRTRQSTLALFNPVGAVLGTPSTARSDDQRHGDSMGEPDADHHQRRGSGVHRIRRQITVVGGPTTIGSMRLTLYDLTATIPDNVDVLLVGPLGQKFILMADAGGSTPIAGQGVTLNIVDTAGQVMPDNGPLLIADYEPTSWTAVSAFPPPAPGLPYNLPGSNVGGTGTQTLLGNFGGTNSNGIWSLYVREDNGMSSPEVLSAASPTDGDSSSWHRRPPRHRSRDASLRAKATRSATLGCGHRRLAARGADADDRQLRLLLVRRPDGRRDLCSHRELTTLHLHGAEPRDHRWSTT